MASVILTQRILFHKVLQQKLQETELFELDNLPDLNAVLAVEGNYFVVFHQNMLFHLFPEFVQLFIPNANQVCLDENNLQLVLKV